MIICKTYKQQLQTLWCFTKAGRMPTYPAVSFHSLSHHPGAKLLVICVKTVYMKTGTTAWERGAHTVPAMSTAFFKN